MNYNQFNILTYLEKTKEKVSQRKISKDINLSLGSVNKIIADLLDFGYINYTNQNELTITNKGLLALEPYKVKRVVFLAAGFGSRMVPITLNTPKPLVLVHGKRIIETLLDAALKAGIKEIYIVRGYLSEQFDVLLKKYPMIKFIDNTIYNEANNISSAYLVRDLLDSAYVCEADLVCYNENLIRKYEYSSNYLGKYVEKTDDWCFEVKNGIISNTTVGGYNCYHMYGVSYWNEKDGKQMAIDIKNVFEMPGGKEKYWDLVALDICKNNYKLKVRECFEGDIIEIDTFNELKEIDKIYDV